MRGNGDAGYVSPRIPPFVAINELLIPPFTYWTTDPLLEARRDTINPLCPSPPSPNSLRTKFWILQTAPESPRTRNITHVTSAINDESSKGPEMMRSLRYHYKVLAMGKFRCWGWHGQTMKLGCSMNRKVVVGEMTKKGRRYISFRFGQNWKGVYWPCISAVFKFI